MEERKFWLKRPNKHKSFILLFLFRLVRQLNINLILMSLIEKADPEVKRHALLAMQKSMIHNWEYLSAPSAVKG